MIVSTPADDLARVVNHWHHEEYYELMVKYISLFVERAAHDSAPASSTGTMDKFVSRLSRAEVAFRHEREAAAQEAPRVARAAAAAAAPRMPLPLTKLAGFGDSKVAALKGQGIKSNEDLAQLRPNLLGEHAARALVHNRDLKKCRAKLREWVALAQAHLEKAGRWPLA